MLRTGRVRGRSGGRAHGRPAQYPTRPEDWFTTAVMRRWRSAAVAAFPHAHQRHQWARDVCLLAPVDRIAPGAVRMQDLLAGCWDGLRHPPGGELLLENSSLWVSAVPLPGGVPDLGVKGASLVAVFGWRYPSGAFAPGRSAPPPTSNPVPSIGIGGSPPFWGSHPGGEEWLPLPPVWAANPHRRLVLFEGGDHAVGLSYTGRLWDSAGARGGGGGGKGGHAPMVAGAVAGLAVALPVVTDVWWVVVPSLRHIQGTVREPDIIKRIHPAVWGLWSVVYRVWLVSRARAECWEAGRAAAAVPHA